jgi:outer membrane protein
MKKKIFISMLSIAGLLILNSAHVLAQENKLTLSLRNVIDLAITQSSSIKYVQNQNVNSYWRWKNFQTRFRPQLTLTGELPNYTHSTTPVTQPDGNIEFKQVSNAQASAQISLSQSIPLTGTYVYAASSIYRIQDFKNKYTDFSGSPFQIGFYQPLFAYNWMKWSKKTEPLVYEGAQKEYIEGIEDISLNATRRFFRYLKVQTNYNLAESNLKNSQDNLKIAETRQQLGQISENDFSRIKLSVYNAQKALNKARMDLKNADFELKSYIGLSQDQEITLIIPLNMTLFEIDPVKALEEAKSNRKETLEYTRRLIEADRQLVEAKRNSGPSITLSASYGLSNSADWLGGVYENTEKQRLLRLYLSIPILDWGRSESQVKLAESRKDLVQYDVTKDREAFERQVIVQVEQFGLLKDQLVTAEEADKVAENGYQISLKKFQNGEISITELNISLSERESARNDYMSSLESYWIAYYNLRKLTLYDFEMQQKISYNNPMLISRK